jgi:hypothetical protein
MPPKKPAKTVVKVITIVEILREYATKKPVKKKSGECHRCGREGHWVADCYARTHVDGEELERE